MTELHVMLKSLGACSEAVNWSNGKKLQEAWATCERPDWMLWLCARMIGKKDWPTHQQVVLCACDCAETVLPIFEGRYPKESAPRVAIETARKWVNGEASLEEVRDAANAAAHAYAAAYAAANAAANAANAADAAAYAAAYAAAHAAANAADAAVYASAAAAYAAAYTANAYAAAYTVAFAADVIYLGALFSKRKELADLIRMKLAIPE